MEDTRFNNQKYVYWLKMNMAFLFAKEGLESLTDELARTFHDDLKKKLGDNTCGSCIKDDLEKQWVSGDLKCETDVCNRWLMEIGGYRTSSYQKLQWKNSDISSLPTSPWECLKMFMPFGCENVTNATEADLAAILTLFINNRHFLNRISDTESLTDFQKVKEIRNKVVHSPTLEVTETEFGECLETTIMMFESNKILKSKSTCQLAIKNIKHLKTTSIEVVTAYERSTLKTSMTAMERIIEELKSYLGHEQSVSHIKEVYAEIVSAQQLLKITGTNECAEIHQRLENARLLLSHSISQTMDTPIDANEPAKKKARLSSRCRKKETNPCMSDAVFASQIKTMMRSKYDGRILELDTDTCEQILEKRIPLEMGGYGQVYHVKDDGGEYVIKKISFDGNDGNQQSAANELLAAGRLMHFAIVPLLAKTEYKRNAIYLLFPYMEYGNLADKLKSDDGKIQRQEDVELTKIRRRCILVQIASAIERLHSEIPGLRGKFIHGNITTKNIVLDTNYNARLTDFGLSRECAAEKKCVTFSDSDKYGTPGYYQTNQQQKLTATKDLFCFGIVILEVLTSKPAIEEDIELRKYKDKIEDISDDYKRNIKAVCGTDKKYVENSLKIAHKCFTEEATSTQILEDLKDLCEDNMFWNYRKKKTESEKCVICMVNPAGSNESNILEHKVRCDLIVCVPCMRNCELNPIQCPSCLEMVEPIIGNKWAAILIAGVGYEKEGSTRFVKDINDLRDVLISRHPQAIGIRKENVHCVEPKGHSDVLKRVEGCFDKVASLDQLDTFVFFYTGHNDKDHGFQLGSQNEFLTIETVQSHMKSLIIKSQVKRVFVFLDCCYAPIFEQLGSHEKIAFFQLNSCTPEQTSHAPLNDSSLFTQVIIKALYGRSLGKVCSISDQYFPEGGLFLIEHLLKFVRKHMEHYNETAPSQRSVTHFINSDNSESELVFAYFMDMKVEFSFQLEFPDGSKKNSLLSKLPESYQRLRLDLFTVFRENCSNDITSLGDEFADVLTIGVKTGPKEYHAQELHSLQQIKSAWIGRKTLYVRLRRLTDIIDGRVGCFLENANSDYIFKYLLGKQENVQKHFQQVSNANVVSVSLEERGVRHLWSYLDTCSESAQCFSLKYVRDQVFKIKKDQKLEKLKKGKLVFTFPLMDNGEDPIQNFYTVHVQTDDVKETC